MRKALIVGIDYYEQTSPLYGCVNDANSVAEILKRNADKTLNFDVNVLTATSCNSIITSKIIKDKLGELFSANIDIALFYFSGHGYTDNGNGYLVTSECNPTRDQFGLRMEDVMQIVNNSNVKNKILIFDCCHAGEMATSKYFNSASIIADGTSILSACTKGQYALENKGSGVFTTLLVDALSGGAASIVGKISPGSVYSHIDQSLGEWEQRPVFKTNIERFISLRDVPPQIPLCDLRLITNFFSKPDETLNLNPSFEFTSNSANTEHVKVFKILQKMASINLVKPVDEDYMYYAAMNSKSCKLTALGQHYWKLVKNERI